MNGSAEGAGPPTLEGLLGNSPEVRVIRALVEAPETWFTRRGLAAEAEVSPTTLQRVLPVLRHHNVVRTQDVRPGGQKGRARKHYAANTESPKLQAVVRFHAAITGTQTMQTRTE